MKDKTPEELALLLTRHCDDLQRYAAGLSEDAVAEFAATEAAVYEFIYQIEATLGGNMANDYRTQRKLDELKDRLAEIRNSVRDEVCDELDRETAELIDTENDFLLGLLAGWFAVSGRTGRALSKADAAKIARYGKYHGLTRRQIIAKVTEGDVSRLYEEIADGLENGSSLAELREAARKQMMTTRRYVKSEIDSIVNGVANDVGLAVASRNRLRLVYLAVLDTSVCEECGGYHGEIYEFDSPDIPALPRHIHCRCRLVPEMEYEASELAVSFREYFETLSEPEKRQRIGQKKYAQHRAGEYRLKPFEEPPASARLALADIRERDAAAFA